MKYSFPFALCLLCLTPTKSFAPPKINARQQVEKESEEILVNFLNTLFCLDKTTIQDALKLTKNSPQKETFHTDLALFLLKDSGIILDPSSNQNLSALRNTLYQKKSVFTYTGYFCESFFCAGDGRLTLSSHALIHAIKNPWGIRFRKNVSDMWGLLAIEEGKDFRSYFKKITRDESADNLRGAHNEWERYFKRIYTTKDILHHIESFEKNEEVIYKTFCELYQLFQKKHTCADTSQKQNFIDDINKKLNTFYELTLSTSIYRLDTLNLHNSEQFFVDIQKELENPSTHNPYTFIRNLFLSWHRKDMNQCFEKLYKQDILPQRFQEQWQSFQKNTTDHSGRCAFLYGMAPVLETQLMHMKENPERPRSANEFMTMCEETIQSELKKSLEIDPHSEYSQKMTAISERMQCYKKVKEFFTGFQFEKELPYLFYSFRKSMKEKYADETLLLNKSIEADEAFIDSVLCIIKNDQQIDREELPAKLSQLCKKNPQIPHIMELDLFFNNFKKCLVKQNKLGKMELE